VKMNGVGRLAASGQPYTYSVMMGDLAELRGRYAFLEAGTMGLSLLGRSIPYLRLGGGPHVVAYNAAHHGLEWLTAPLLMRFAGEFCAAYASGGSMLGVEASRYWRDVSVYLVPMVNPDGVELALNGLTPGNPNAAALVRWNRGSADFSRTWQANNGGVDLNHNYDAGFWESRAAIAARASGSVNAHSN